jgi:hypothetical protein
VEGEGCEMGPGDVVGGGIDGGVGLGSDRGGVGGRINGEGDIG